MNLESWNKLYLAELIFSLISELYIVFVVDLNKVSSFTLLFDSSILIVAGIIVILLLNKKNKKINTINNWLMLLCVPYILCYILNTLFAVLFLSKEKTSLVYFLIFCLLYVLVLIPFVEVVLPQLKGLVSRILTLISIIAALLSNCYVSLDSNSILEIISKTQLIAAVAMVILAKLIANAWSFNFKPNLKLKIGPNFKWYWFVLIIAFSIWYSFFGSFLLVSNNFWNALFHWDFSLFDFTWKSGLTALEPAILEELFRYLLMLIVVFAFKNTKNYVPFAILISSVIFSLMHFSNLLSANFYDVIVQVIFTLGLGILAAAVYLYIGKLWLVMIMHFIIDFLQFSRGPLAMVETGYITTDVYLLIIVGLPLIVTLLMIFSKLRKIMNKNALRLIK